jgi:ABC-type multidrug transport system fused ATPase/permease subunit
MGELGANAATMVRLSWGADRWRSMGALLTTVFLPVTGSLRAVGVALLADGVVAGDRSRAVAGVAVVAGLVGTYHVLEWANAAMRMRLREHTILFLDQRVMGLVAGLPGLEHHERPDYQDHMELLRRSRGSLVNPFMPIPWSLAALVQLAVTVAILGRLHPLLWALPLAAVPSVLGSISTERGWRRLWEEQAEDQRLLSHVFELATLPPAGKEVRLFALADELQERYRRTYWRMERRRRAMSVRAAAVKAGGWAVFALAYMGATILVVHRAVEGRLSVGSAVLVLTLGSQVNGQVAELVFLTSWFHRTVEAVSHYRWLERRAEEATAAASAQVPAPVPSRLTSGVAFTGVSFSYPGTSRPALKGITFAIAPGQTVALVGASGAGKSTLGKLLLRFHDPDTGRITLDGYDLRDLTLTDLRSHISAVLQETLVFDGTIRDNILWGRPDATEADVVAAATAADAHEFIRALPEGYQTRIGQRGRLLSGGQRQRLAIARAMIRDAPVLLLDEPTTGLDAASTQRVLDPMRRLMAGRTTVIISHNLLTVTDADQILFLREGRITGAGTHDELLASNPDYAHLYRLHRQPRLQPELI